MNDEPGIKFTNDGKGKRQSVEARWEFEKSTAGGFLTFSAMSWDVNHREALANLFTTIAAAGIKIDPSAQITSPAS